MLGGGGDGFVIGPHPPPDLTISKAIFTTAYTIFGITSAGSPRGRGGIPCNGQPLDGGGGGVAGGGGDGVALLGGGD